MIPVSAERIAWACLRAEQRPPRRRRARRRRRPARSRSPRQRAPAPRRAGRRAPGPARRAPRGRPRRSACCPRTRPAARAPTGTFSSPATTSTPKAASRSAIAALSSVQASFLRQSCLSLASKTIRPERPALGGADLDHGVALLAAALGVLVAGVGGESPRAAAIPRSPRGRAPRTCGPCGSRPPRPRRRAARASSRSSRRAICSQLGDLALHARATRSRVPRVAARPRCAVALLGLERSPRPIARLDRDQRVDSSSAESSLDELLRCWSWSR